MLNDCVRDGNRWNHSAIATGFLAVNVCQSCGAFRACILGTFSHATCYPIGFASWTGQQKVCMSIPSKLYRRQEHFRWQNSAVNVNQSPASPWDLVLGTFSHTTCCPFSFAFQARFSDRSVSQALDRLVLVSCTHCCASTSSLSTLSSSRGLTSL